MKLVANSDIVGNPTVALRWCLVPEEIQYIKDNKISNPHILLVVVNNKKEVDRQLLPVGDLMTYLTFNHPRENTVLATIVWHHTLKLLRKYYLGKDKYGYENRFYDKEDDGLVNTSGYGLDSITVNVSADFFAPEPAEWEKWWVNLCFETKPKDQCQFRKRRILAYTAQLPLVLFWVFITVLSRLVAAMYLVIIKTRTKVKFSPIIHPFKMDMEHIWYTSLYYGRNIYLRKKDGTEREDYTLFCLLFHPITIILFSLILLIIDTTAVNWFLGYWAYLLGAIAASVVIIITILLIIALWAIGEWVVDNIKTWRKTGAKDKQLERARQQKAKKAEKEKAEKLAEQARQLALKAKMEKLEKEFSLISCNGGPLVPKLAALPPEKRTVHLRFLDLKARVCKPFAG